jgi:hypothetical protein
VVQRLVAALGARGYALFHPPDGEVLAGEDTFVVLELAEHYPAGACGC